MWAGKTARGWGREWELSLFLSSSFLVIISRSLISSHTPHDLNAGNRIEVAWCNGIRIPESKKVLLVGSRIWQNFLVESQILGFGIRNTAQGIRNPTNNCNLESTFPRQGLKSTTWKSGIHEVEFRIQDCLGFPCMGCTWLRVAKQPRNCMQRTFWYYRWINMHISQTRNSFNYK